MSLFKPALAAAFALISSLAIASPQQELHDAFVKFLAAKSFRATVTDVKSGQQLSTLQFVAPDRYHIVSGQGDLEQVLIGDDAYTVIEGRRVKLPVPIQVGRIVGQYRNESTLQQLEKDLQVVAVGNDTIEGEAASVYTYTVTQPAKADVTVWVSRNSGLPIQLESKGSFMHVKSTTRVNYSDFDDASIRVSAPE